MRTLKLTFFLAITSSFQVHGQWDQLGSSIYGEFAGDWCGHGSVMNDNGNRVAIGSVKNDDSGSNAGHVRVFDFDGDEWIQIGETIEGENPLDVIGHMWTLDMDTTGNILVIGSQVNDDAAENAGHVRVYQFDGSDWVQLGTDIDGAEEDWGFGSSISISDNGTVLAVGCGSYDSDLGADIGTVFIFEFDGVDWVQIGSEITGDNPGDKYGAKVALNADGTMFAASAYLSDDTGTNTGELKIYEFDGTDWVQVGEEIHGDDDGDRLGGSGVCLSADGLIVGASSYASNTGGSLRGKVQFFKFTDGEWAQLGSDVYGDANSDFFGISLDASRNGLTFAAGAYGNDFTASIAGQVKVYKFFGGDWNLLYSPIYGVESLERIGNSVSINSTGTRVVVGGPTSSVLDFESGVARIYDAEPCVLSYAAVYDTSCYSYTVPSGDETYDSSGLYNDTLFNSCGGDSILTIHLTIHETAYNNINILECVSYTPPSGDSTYLASTEIVDTLSTVFGCDSLLFIDLIIGNSSSEYSVFACDSLLVPSGDEVYFESGTYTDTITSVVGCDSVMTINLIIGRTEASMSENSCFSYTVPSGNVTYTESGVYIDTLVNGAGCDSIITIDLTISSIEALISFSEGVFFAEPDFMTYQWVSCYDFELLPAEINQTFTPIIDGDFAVIVTDDFCTDTSECLTFSKLSIPDNSTFDGFEILPNPLIDFSIIKFSKALNGNQYLLIYNVIGQEVYRNETFESNTVILNNADFEPGIYFVSLYNRNKLLPEWTAKLVVE